MGASGVSATPLRRAARPRQWQRQWRPRQQERGFFSHPWSGVGALAVPRKNRLVWYKGVPVTCLSKPRVGGWMVGRFFSPKWAAWRQLGGGRAVAGLSRQQGPARQTGSQPRPSVLLCGFRLDIVRWGNGLAWKRVAAVGPRGRGGAGRAGADGGE